MNKKLKLYSLAALTALAPGQLMAQDYNSKIMDRVMVIGSQDKATEIAGSATFIDQENLDDHDYTDINHVLRQVPGINIQEEEGHGNRPNIGFRGGRSERSADITLMEDGILIAPAPYSAPSAYYFPRVSRMSAVEIRKGSSTIEFGPRTTSGALNLISSPTPEKQELEVSMAYGNHDTQIIELSQGNKINNFSYIIDVGHEESSGFKEIDIVGGDTGYSIQDVMAKFKLTSDDDAEIYQSIELKLGYTQEDSDETYLGLTNADFNDNPFRRYAASQKDNITSDHQQYQLQHFADFTSFDLTTTLYRNEFARNWYKLKDTVTDNSDQSGLKVRANNREYYSQGIQSVLGSEFKTSQLAHKLKFSTRYHQDQEDRFQRDDTYDLVSGEMNLTSQGVDGAAGNREVESKALALYLSDAVTYNKLTVTPGLRYENIQQKRADFNDPSTNNENDLEVLVPGISTLYKFNDHLATFAGVHKGFSPPTPGEADSKEEESTNYELGLRYNKDSLKSSLTGFFNDYSNLLGECTASSGGGCTIGDQFSAGGVEVKGFEFELGYDLAKLINNSKFQIPLNFNYTFTDANFKNNFTNSSFDEWGDVEAGDELAYIAKNQFFTSIGLIRPKWEAHLNAKYMGEMRSTAGKGSIPQDELIDSHFVVDLSGEYEIEAKTRLFVRAQNIFDERYVAALRPIGARPGPPLSVLAGLKYKF